MERQADVHSRSEGDRRMSLHQALTQLESPTRTRAPRFHVFGRVVTRQEALQMALALSERGDHRAAARVLDAAGLWPHDLVDAHRRKAH